MYFEPFKGAFFTIYSNIFRGQKNTSARGSYVFLKGDVFIRIDSSIGEQHIEQT